MKHECLVVYCNACKELMVTWAGYSSVPQNDNHGVSLCEYHMAQECVHYVNIS